MWNVILQKPLYVRLYEYLSSKITYKGLQYYGQSMDMLHSHNLRIWAFDVRRSYYNNYLYNQ